MAGGRGGGRGVDRVGTSFLRFLHVLAAELTATAALGEAAGGTGPAGAAEATSRSQALARERCRRDPGLADHWLELAELQEASGRGHRGRRDAGVGGACGATPPTPALLFAWGCGRPCSRTGLRRRARSRTRWRWSRWPRATTTRAWTRRRWCRCWPPSAATRRRWRPRGACWPTAATATAAFWRAEALQALGAEPSEVDARGQAARRPGLAHRGGAGAGRSRHRTREGHATPATAAGLAGLARAREALEAGRPDQAVREARRRPSSRLAELGAA